MPEVRTGCTLIHDAQKSTPRSNSCFCPTRANCHSERILFDDALICEHRRRNVDCKPNSSSHEACLGHCVGVITISAKRKFCLWEA